MECDLFAFSGSYLHAGAIFLVDLMRASGGNLTIQGSSACGNGGGGVGLAILSCDGPLNQTSSTSSTWLSMPSVFLCRKGSRAR